MQRQCLAVSLDPAHHLALVVAQPARQARGQLRRPLPAILQPLAALGLALECGRQRLQRIDQGFHHHLKSGAISNGLVRQARIGFGKGQPQVTAGFFDATDQLGQHRHIACHAQGLDLRIAAQICYLPGRNGLAKKQRRRIWQLVRLVKNHRIAGGQQLGHTLIAQHHIGKKQMVVDYYHLGIKRLAPRRQDEALLVIGTRLPEAVFARRRGISPGRRILGDFGQFAPVATGGCTRKMLYQPQVARRLARGQARLLEIVCQMIVADVIGAPLEQRDGDRHAKSIAHGRQIAGEQLILQGLGSGRDNDLAAREQRRNKIRDRLTSTGTGLGHQHRVVANGLGDASGHFHLLRTLSVGGDAAAKQAIRCEHLLKRGYGHIAGMLSPVPRASYEKPREKPPRHPAKAATAILFPRP